MKKPKQAPKRLWLVVDAADGEAEGPFLKRKDAVEWRDCRHRDGYLHASVAGPYVLATQMKSEDR